MSAPSLVLAHQKVITVDGATVIVTAATEEDARRIARDIEAAVRPEPVALGCDHCGGDAISSVTGRFWDGEGEACAECGWPGWISADEDGAYWVEADEGHCNRADCECNEEQPR
jgi:hypothetical protein